MGKRRKKERKEGRKEGRGPYSNFSAATMLGNPETRPIISQGRKVSRDVRTAPPLDSPLCCFRRRGGFGVEPI